MRRYVTRGFFVVFVYMCLIIIILLFRVEDVCKFGFFYDTINFENKRGYGMRELWDGFMGNCCFVLFCFMCFFSFK